MTRVEGAPEGAVAGPEEFAAAVEAARGSGARWGASDAVLGVLTLFTVGAVLGGLAAELPAGAEPATAVALLLSYAAACAVAVWRPRTGAGGLRATIGLAPPRGTDATLVVVASVVLYVLSVLAVVGLQQLPWLSGADADNASFLADTSLGERVLLVVLVVVAAPVVEEVLFRGVMLHGLTRRWGFWPATAVSSVLFGVLHMLAADSAGAAVLLAASTAVLGVGLCLLVRRTGRIGPGVVVHASRNAFVVLLVLSGSGGV